MCFLLSSTLAANAVLCCAVLCRAVPGQHLVVLQRTQPKPGDKSQPTWTIFSFAPSFCALMIIGLISFNHRSHCSPLGPLGMHRILALFVFSPSLVGVKSFKDIEPHVVCLISRFRVCLTVPLIFYSCVLLLPQDRSNGLWQFSYNSLISLFFALLLNFVWWLWRFFHLWWRTSLSTLWRRSFIWTFSIQTFLLTFLFRKPFSASNC